MLSREELAKRLNTPEGIRPQAAPIPELGVYWIKQTELKHAYWIDVDGNRLDKPTHNAIYGIYSWENSEESDWLLAFIINKDGTFELFSSDEIYHWETPFTITTTVGPRVDPPA